MELRIGCSGWSYKGWVGPFYPRNKGADSFLELYSRVFDTVEIDSTFYRIPEESMVYKWRNSTPDGFLFAPKMPKKITHEMNLLNAEPVLDSFIDAIRGLGRKLGPVLIQLPPFFAYETGYESFRNFITDLPQDVEFAVEFRHDSWFREDVFRLLEKYNVTLAWSEIPIVKPIKELTTNSVYLRMIGDRSIPEANFGRIQKDRPSEIRKWASEIKMREQDLEKAFIFSNNHFQGFSPATANLFREALGLKKIDWNLKVRTSDPEKQRTLF